MQQSLVEIGQESFALAIPILGISPLWDEIPF